MAAEEGHLEVPGGRIWFSRVGSGGVPLLTLHGGPGFPHDYLEALEDLADRRTVIFFDQLGCGRSDHPDDNSLWTVDFFVDEVEVVRRALGLERFHLLGSSWGGMLAMAYALDRNPPLTSLIIANSPASAPRQIADNAVLRAALPADVQQTMAWHEQHGLFDCPEYAAATAEWYRRHICRMNPWPLGLERAIAGAGREPYKTMWGPSEFFVTGNLREWDVTGRLHEITAPTLFISGEYDEIQATQIREMHAAVPGSQYLHFANSAHLPFEEERELFMAQVNEFMTRAESQSG
jgi:proline-specific peptidase